MTDFQNENQETEEFISEEEILRQYKKEMSWYKLEHHPSAQALYCVRENLNEAYNFCKDGNFEVAKKAAEIIENAILIIKKEKLKLTYQDWCLIFKMQAMPGGFYSIMPNYAGVRGSKLTTMWIKDHPYDVDFIMAAIFNGYEDILPIGYEQLYYNLAKTRGTKYSYFKENSIKMEGQMIPHHVVYAAISNEIPESVYVKNTLEICSSIPSDRLGVPKVWTYYTWDDFLAEYRFLVNKFKETNGRDISPADTILASLTQSNHFHGRRLLEPKSCSLLAAWIEALPYAQKQMIIQIEQSKWTLIE
jgi:hypothetical protein